MTTWYNETDSKAAAWLRELIRRDLIAPGDVDTRSIEDVSPDDLRPYTQCHFFAGIGVWSYALRRAGWPDDRPAWTGSCPCQPFSAAGKGGGFDDERHLWPAWHWLVEQCRPPIIFGEQVASKNAEPWLDLVQADLEIMGYAVGAIPFPSAGVGAPHIRDRLYWVADAEQHDCGRQAAPSDHGESQTNRPADRVGRCGGVSSRLADRDGSGRISGGEGCAATGHGPAVESDCGAGDARDTAGPTNGLWSDVDWLFCRDGKWRPVEPGAFPLAHGAPARVGRLRGYGNAINAEAATAWIETYLECAPHGTTLRAGVA